MRTMAPASLVAKIQSGYVEFCWKGDTGPLKAILGEVAAADPGGEITSCRWDVDMIDRDFGAARGVLQDTDLSELSYTNAALTPKSFLQGLIELAEGDQAQAQRSFELARPAFEKAVEEAPLSANRHANLGWFYAFAGRKDDAIREGRRAVELKPESKDAVDGAIMNCYLALIYARVGENDLAIPLIERLLKTPGAVDSTNYSITVNDLKYRWEWDPLRNDPRLQKLITQSAPQELSSAKLYTYILDCDACSTLQLDSARLTREADRLFCRAEAKESLQRGSRLCCRRLGAGSRHRTGSSNIRRSKLGGTSHRGADRARFPRSAHAILVFRSHPIRNRAHSRSCIGK